MRPFSEQYLNYNVSTFSSLSKLKLGAANLNPKRKADNLRNYVPSNYRLGVAASGSDDN